MSSQPLPACSHLTPDPLLGRGVLVRRPVPYISFTASDARDRAANEEIRGLGIKAAQGRLTAMSSFSHPSLRQWEPALSGVSRVTSTENQGSTILREVQLEMMARYPQFKLFHGHVTRVTASLEVNRDTPAPEGFPQLTEASIELGISLAVQSKKKRGAPSRLDLVFQQQGEGPGELFLQVSMVTLSPDEGDDESAAATKGKRGDQGGTDTKEEPTAEELRQLEEELRAESPKGPEDPDRTKSPPEGEKNEGERAKRWSPMSRSEVCLVPTGERVRIDPHALLQEFALGHDIQTTVKQPIFSTTLRLLAPILDRHDKTFFTEWIALSQETRHERNAKRSEQIRSRQRRK